MDDGKCLAGKAFWACRRTRITEQEGTSLMQATARRPKITPTTDGGGVVSYAGARLLAHLADGSTLTGRLSAALRALGGAADGA
jgi:hypothetical protein